MRSVTVPLVPMRSRRMRSWVFGSRVGRCRSLGIALWRAAGGARCGRDRWGRVLL